MSATPTDGAAFLAAGLPIPLDEVPVDLRATDAPALDGQALGDAQSAAPSNGNGMAKGSKAGPWRKLLTMTPGRAKGPDGKPALVVRASAHNVTVVLTNHEAWLGVLAFDERLSAPVFLRPPPFADHYAAQSPTPCPRVVDPDDAPRIRAWLEREEHLNPRPEEVRDGVLMAAQRAPFDAVRTYLDGLTWDGVARLDTWLVDYLGAAESPYTRAVGARWLISGVARVRRPGCKVDTVLVLEGEQGAGKSRALAALMPEPAWFADELGDLRNPKEAAHGLAGKWLVEVSELAALGKSEVEVVKAFLSRGTDHFRAPYAPGPKDYHRRGIFAGTTNADTYLRDASGARRFWPVKVGKVYVAELASDRDQLWAEASARYADGERWWLHEGVLVADATNEQEARYVADAWERTIGEWLDEPLQATRDRFGLGDVLSGALHLEVGKHDQAAQNRVANALKRLKWKRRQARRGKGERWYFYERPSRVSRVEGDDRGNP